MCPPAASRMPCAAARCQMDVPQDMRCPAVCATTKWTHADQWIRAAFAARGIEAPPRLPAPSNRAPRRGRLCHPVMRLGRAPTGGAATAATPSIVDHRVRSEAPRPWWDEACEVLRRSMPVPLPRLLAALRDSSGRHGVPLPPCIDRCCRGAPLGVDVHCPMHPHSPHGRRNTRRCG